MRFQSIMREFCKKIFLSAAFVILISGALCPRSLLAQSLLQSWSTQPQLSYEFYHPEFSKLNYKGFTSISFLSIRYPFGENLLLDADLPFVYFKNPAYVYTSSDRGHFSPGNPYIGVTVYNPASPVTVNVGIRIPLVSYDDINYPIIANSTAFYRYHSASQHVFTLNLRGHYFGKINSAINYQFYLGGLAVLNTQGGGDGQLLVPYGVSLRYQKKQAILGCGISGIMSITEQHANLGQRSMNHLYVEGGLNFKSWSPDVYLALPLDKDSSNLINLIIGLRITLKLNEISK